MLYPYGSWAHYTAVTSTEQRDGPNDGLLQEESGLAEEEKSLPQSRKKWQNVHFAIEVIILACSVVVFSAAGRRLSLHEQQCRGGSPWSQWREFTIYEG